MSKKTKMKKRPRGGASMPCPTCNKNTHVVITRRGRFGDSVLRVRECTARGRHRFNTVEQVRS